MSVDQEAVDPLFAFRKAAEEARLFVIRLTGPDGRALGYAVAERLFYITAEDAAKSQLGQMTFDAIDRSFSEREPGGGGGYGVTQPMTLSAQGGEPSPQIGAQVLALDAKKDPEGFGMLGVVSNR